MKVDQQFLRLRKDPKDPDAQFALPDWVLANQDPITRGPVIPHPESPDLATLDFSNREPATRDPVSPDSTTHELATPHHATPDPACALPLRAPSCARTPGGTRRMTRPREVSDSGKAWAEACDVTGEHLTSRRRPSWLVGEGAEHGVAMGRAQGCEREEDTWALSGSTGSVVIADRVGVTRKCRCHVGVTGT
ncbi:uncharacterized protein LOC116068864 isoform X2 [Mastomys coucha]|uniref:uncharacterized protein LOC116068864 isoform X2 n=1 Tax=Mastomys coucha TaxID=35658 RepID=UPI0012627F17|nr:uncharacterized protein LOC116068864 isoform X2 [Mastomys coucha]